MTRILLVEDEKVIRDLLVEILEEAGYEVVSAATADEALELVDDELALVLSDIVMPGLSGLELLSALRTRRPSLPVVLMTGAGTYEHLTQALDGGADGLVAKPFSHNTLKAAVASALDRARRSERELRGRLLTSTLASALANAIESRDGEGDGHCERVASLAVFIGAQVQLGSAELDAIRLGGILHDVGKIRIPDRVLLKSEELTAEELALMRTHPIIGDRLLEPLELLESTRPAVLHHHERWDGQGYPEGLEGEDIPLAARIVALADGVESMSTRRVHRDALDKHTIVQELEAGRGRQWDPRLVDVVVELLGSGLLVLTPKGLQILDTGSAEGARPVFSVLLVEDDPDHAALAIEALEGDFEDVKVVHAPDAASATELCKGSTWSLALLDYQLPDGTGLELLDMLRGLAPDVPIVMMTGSDSLAIEAFRRGASDFVVKTPGYLDVLTGRVRVLMEAR